MEGVPDEIRARKFVVVDEKGERIAVLEFTEEGHGALGLLNNNGVTQVELVAGENSGVAFNAPDGNLRAAIVLEGGVAGLLLVDPKGTPQVTAAATGEEGGIIDLRAEKGYERIFLGSTRDNHGAIWVFDKYGENPQSYGHRY